jgi:hypothetical protein
MPLMDGVEMMKEVLDGIGNRQLEKYNDTIFVLSTAQGERSA